MRYAKVALGLPVEGPFDYIMPEGCHRKIKPGSRVWVSFSHRRLVGYIVGVSGLSHIKNLKPIIKIIDASALLTKNMLALAKKLAQYYCCSVGQIIETALPSALRRGREISQIEDTALNKTGAAFQLRLLYDLSKQSRWDIYIAEIKDAYQRNDSTIMLCASKQTALQAVEIIRASISCPVAILFRDEPQELEEWLKVRQGKVSIVVGTRSAIFAPFPRAGLIIVDEEQDPAYKQDQVPHYHAREAAFARAHLEEARLILASSCPSLESFYFAQKNKINYEFLPQKEAFAEIKIINPSFRQRAFKQKNIFSRYLEETIFSTLNAEGKALLFINRRGFATVASCISCGAVFKCPRCNINLVYHFKDNLLSCHHCNFKMPAPKICPQCNCGYLKFSGMGTEKIESEIARIFPQAKVARLDKSGELNQDSNLFISTAAILKEAGIKFDLVVVLAIDNSLNRIDFRAAEKTFGILLGLWNLAEKKMVIETWLGHHHCFRALENKDVRLFYQQELSQRKELNLPPYKHLCLVKLRGKVSTRVKQLSQDLFAKLNAKNTDKSVKIIATTSGDPAKLRGNFYRQILISSDNANKISRFLKINLKPLRYSGIIVTVDIDPV